MAWVETVVNGVLLGGLYGLFGLGLAVVFGVMRVVNLAHGEIVVMAAYAGVFLTGVFPGAPLLPVIAVVTAAAFGLGYALQATLVNRAIASTNPLAAVLLTFGLSVILRNSMAELFGADPHALEGGSLTQVGIGIMGLRIGAYPLLVLLVAVALFAGLQWLLYRTRYGRIVRATADDREVARLMGVNPERVYNVVMGVSLAFAAVAGLLLAIRTSFTPFSGVERLLLAFEVVIIGGLGSFWGALAGGIALGVAQLLGQKLDSNAGPLYAHVLFFLILVLRPSGLAGARA